MNSTELKTINIDHFKSSKLIEILKNFCKLSQNPAKSFIFFHCDLFQLKEK